MIMAENHSQDLDAILKRGGLARPKQKSLEIMFQEIVDKNYVSCNEVERWKIYESYKNQISSMVYDSERYREALRGLVYLLQL